jgi:ATP-dependent DNA ligase
MPRVESRLLYVDAVAGRGVDLFAAACDHDLEGIVAKWSRAPYGLVPSWIKIKNAAYSQMADTSCFERGPSGQTGR